MIYTLTTNPSLDHYLSLDVCKLEKGIYRTDDKLVVGGKGLNVSIVLNNLGTRSSAICFLGGFVGDFIRTELKKYSLIQLLEIKIKNNNRINTKIRYQEETDLNTQGPLISNDEENELLERIKEIKENDYLLICGKLNNGLSQDFLKKIKKNCLGKLVLDIDGLTINDLKNLKPFLIKPNEKELNDYQVDVNEIKKYVDYLLVSKADKGAILYHGDVVLEAKQKPVNVVNTTGAGDSMLAAFIYGLSQFNLEESLRFAVACGISAVSQLSLPNIQDINNHVNDVTIIRR